MCVFKAVVAWFLCQKDKKCQEGDSMDLDPFQVLQHVRFSQIDVTRLCTEVIGGYETACNKIVTIA